MQANLRGSGTGSIAAAVLLGRRGHGHAVDLKVGALDEVVQLGHELLSVQGQRASLDDDVVVTAGTVEDKTEATIQS